MKRRIVLPLVLATALVMPLAACSGMPGAGGASGQSAPGPVTQLGDAAVAPESKGALPATGGTSGSMADRSVIRTGDVALEVSDPRTAADEVAELAEQLGGRVESSTVQRSGGDTVEQGASASVTMRVPEDRLDEAFDELSGVGEVLSQSRSEFDVTRDHVDLQARVAALEESVTRLTELMANATTTSELLEAETALSQRQQELDGLRAQLKSLESQVDEATIFVSLQTRSALPGGGPANFWEGLLAGIGSLGTAAAGALVIAGMLLPWLLLAGLVALVVVLIVRAVKRGGSRRAAAGNASQRSATAAAPGQAPAASPAAAPAPQSPHHSQAGAQAPPSQLPQTQLPPYSEL